jgi:hypothetical protein
MPAQIDWKAEDEGNWRAIEPEIQPASGGRRPRWTVRNILLALTVVAALAALIVSQLNHFVQSNARRAERELLAAHDLVISAATEGDVDLLRQLTVDRAPEWTAAELLLAESGLWLDRAPLGLHVVNDGSRPQAAVSLDPALSQALITVTMSYQVGDGDIRAQAIRLQQTFIYRHVDERWLLSPPPSEYWGSRESSGGRYLAMSYPEKDAETGRRLAADLEAVLGQACLTVERLNCEPDGRLAIDLVADPALIADLADPAWPLHSGRAIRLPTPTVIGLPQDEPAYRVLYYAYARLVVLRLISQQTALDESEQPLLALSLLSVILRQMGLQPANGATPMVNVRGAAVVAALERMWNSHASLADAQAGGDGEIARAVAEYLASGWSEVPETEMLRALGRSGSFQEWLQSLAPDAAPGSFEEAWDLDAADSLSR